MSIVKVAGLAGVSVSTVSRVINKHRVSDETAKAVHDAMKELNFTPSKGRPGPKPKGSAASRRESVIGFLVLGSSQQRATSGFEYLMRGVTKGVSRFNAKLVFHDLGEDQALPEQIAEGGVDGLLLHGAAPAAKISERLNLYPSVWLMGDGRNAAWGDQVIPDFYDIGANAARYLCKREHKHLAFLNLDLGHWPFPIVAESFAASAAERGATCQTIERPRSENERTNWHQFAVAAAEELAQRYLKFNPRPTGLFVADDMQVAVIQPALQRAGINLAPGDIEIISCNNARPYLVGLFPKPAEVDIRVEEIGLRGVERILWRLSNPTVTERIVTTIEPRIVGHEGEPITL